MAKYIIDIPDEYEKSYDQTNSETLYIPMQVGTRNYNVWVGTGLRVTPYTEPNRKAIEDEVWDFASMLMNMHPDVAEDIYWSMNGGKGIGVAAEMTYQEAKSKYEEWKKQKDEIRVGDEVVYADDPNKEKAIVLRVYQPKQYKTLADIFCEDGTVVKMIVVENIARTGRHFYEVVEMLKKMMDAE